VAQGATSGLNTTLGIYGHFDDSDLGYAGWLAGGQTRSSVPPED